MGIGAGDQAEKAVDKRRVPLLTRSLAQGADRFLFGPPRPVGPVAGHRDEGIRDRDDSGEERDRLADHPIRVPRAVDPFVMVANGGEQLV